MNNPRHRNRQQLHLNRNIFGSGQTSFKEGVIEKLLFASFFFFVFLFCFKISFVFVFFLLK